MSSLADDDPLLGSAGYLLLKAGHYIREEFEAGLRAVDLNAREMLVLSFVGATAGLSQQELSKRLGIDPTLIVGLVDQLEGRGLMERNRDPEDRRRNVLSLTAAGEALQADAMETATRIEDDFLAPLSPDERVALRGLLRSVMMPRLAWLGE
ncbi:MAG: MarR family winged helix-turn-helix transcriptional regulator [Acidimicrobiales bacterium]